MAKVFNFIPTTEELALLERSLMVNWSGATQKVILRNRDLSRYKQIALTMRALMLECGRNWRELSDNEKLQFKLGLSARNWTGWNGGVANFFAQRKLGNADISAAFPTAGTRMGCILSPTLGQTIKIAQAHPLYYYKAERVPGTKSRRMAVLVNEYNPIRLETRMSVSTGGTAEAFDFDRHDTIEGPNFQIKLTVRFYSGIFRGNSYREKDHYFPSTSLNLAAILNERPNVNNYVGYDVMLTVRDFVGRVFFYNLDFYHHGFNWARDPYTKKVEARFIGHLAPVLNNWDILQKYSGAKIYSRGGNLVG